MIILKVGEKEISGIVTGVKYFKLQIVKGWLTGMLNET